ncbi:Elongation factor Tu GTP binding domain [Ceratobasidium sp. AG-Ba]|nr:Elongation factor Tu GTP binding domain [Ceratobasidium sp. AG-Ba]
MGHVDHGKTTLLDTLRSASVAAGEAGGITQHIGAFSVPIQSSSTTGPRTVTFLDTPGHAAFSAMRARGAGVTDIVVLVVAADDGVMPQTKEVIELARRGAAEGEGGLQLVVAINKCDKPGDKVKKALLAEGVQLEEFGGDVPAVEVSGLTGAGLDTLTETLSTLAEMAELRAEVDIRAHGRVLESRVDKGRGPVATVLIQRGSLKAASALVAGTSWARVRQMTDDKGRPVSVAKPGDAVTVAGWKEVPSAGDEVLQVETEDAAKRAVVNRKRVQESRALAEDVERINEKRRADKILEEQERSNEEDGDTAVPNGVQAESTDPEVKELRLVIKGDVSGSIEAVAGALCGIGNKIAKVKIVSQSVGEISESDITLAKAVDGMIVGFNVNAPSKIHQLAERQGVPVLIEGIIYKLMDEIKKRVIALLPVTYEQRVLGEATVQEIFTISLKGRATTNIAGCRIVNGVIAKNAKARVMRDGVEVYDGSIESLKQHKKEMTEMRKGNECGMSFTKFEDLKAGDHIQTYETIEKPGIL